MTFRPGQSGNPGGRPKAAAAMRDLIQTRGAELIDLLMTMAFAPATDDRTRLEAIKILLDRGFGKAVQPVEGDGEGGPVHIECTWLPVSDTPSS